MKKNYNTPETSVLAVKPHSIICASVNGILHHPTDARDGTDAV